jgi:hypothetical protein
MGWDKGFRLGVGVGVGVGVTHSGSGSGFRVSGFRVSGFRVQGLGLRLRGKSEAVTNQGKRAGFGFRLASR